MSQLTKVLSFDPASVRNLGWSLVEVDEVDKDVCQEFRCEAGTIVLPKVTEPWEALWPMFVSVDTTLLAQKPELIIIEKTSSFAGGFVTGQVSNCIGVILACCGKHELPVSFVYPSHVKKVVTGNGRATKSQMKKRVQQLVSDLSGGKIIKFDSEHACDATANILCWLIENEMIEEEEV